VQSLKSLLGLELVRFVIKKDTLTWSRHFPRNDDADWMYVYSVFISSVILELVFCRESICGWYSKV